MVTDESKVLPLDACLLGPFAVSVRGLPLRRTRSRKETLLLAMLILAGGAELTRVTLAQKLWPFPDYSEDHARQNLRRSLADLRKALGVEAPRLVAPSPRTVALDLTDCAADVLQFDAIARRLHAATLHGESASGAQETYQGLCETLIGLYRGPLLAGETAEWIVAERERRLQVFQSTLRNFSARALSEGDYEAAVRVLRHAVSAAPLYQPACRALMEALRRCERFADAAQVYSSLLRTLRRETGALPEEETERLYARIQAEARPRTSGAGRGGASVKSAHRNDEGVVGTPLTRSAAPLPEPFTRLIGRDAALTAIDAHLYASRLVTLVGPGGVGKTRLALAAAGRAGDRFAGGAALVELAPLSDPAGVPQAIAAALDIREQPGKPLLNTLAEILRHRAVLLILDNCEHLVQASARAVAAILAGSPQTRVLATSRQPLGLLGEAVWRVPSLGVPPAESVALTPAQVARMPDEYPAVQLFVERAGGDFALTPENAPAVAALCRNLDGIPHLLELAAARTRALSVEEIVARLDNRLALLATESGSIAPRQQTVEGMISWSYDLLTEEERRLLNRLSIFHGGLTVAAAEAVCADPGGADGSLARNRIALLLSALVEKSLVQRDRDRDGQSRFRLFESVRQFTESRLTAKGKEAESDRLRARYARHFQSVAEMSEKRLQGPEQARWLRELKADYDNIRAAIRYSLSHDPAGALAMTGSLWKFWTLVGYASEALSLIGEALAATTDATAPTAWARCLIARGIFTDYAAESVPYLPEMEQGLALTRAAGDRSLECWALLHIGWVYRHVDAVWRDNFIQQSLALARSIGDDNRAADALSTLGYFRLYSGDPDGAAAFFEDGFAYACRCGDRNLIAELTYHRALTAMGQGRFALARGLLDEAVAVTQNEDRPVVASILHYRAWLESHEGDIPAAESSFRECLRMSWEMGHTRKIASIMRGLAQVAVAKREWERATSLLAASASLDERTPMPLLDFTGGDAVRIESRIRENISEDDFIRFWSRGSTMSPEEAVAYTLR